MVVNKYKAGQIYDHSEDGRNKIWLRNKLAVKLKGYEVRGARQSKFTGHMLTEMDSFYRFAVGYGSTFYRVNEDHLVTDLENKWWYCSSRADRTRWLMGETKMLTRFNSAFAMLIF